MTTVKLDYESATTQLPTSATFYHEFEIGLTCNQNTVLDLDTDYERVGVGLAIASTSAEPKIRLNSFEIKPYIQED